MAEPKPKDKDRDEKDESFKKFEDLTDKLLRVPKKEALSCTNGLIPCQRDRAESSKVLVGGARLAWVGDPS